MKIATSTGHYSIVIDGEIKPEKVSELAVKGLSNDLLFRGVFAPLREKTGAKRKLEESAAFNAEIAKHVRSEVEKALTPYVDALVISVSEYVGGEPASAVLKDALKVAKARESLPDAEYAKWLAALPYDGETHDAAGEFSQAFLLAISDKIRKVRAAAVAGV